MQDNPDRLDWKESIEKNEFDKAPKYRKSQEVQSFFPIHKTFITTRQPLKNLDLNDSRL
jgi:hypothetical protein